MFLWHIEATHITDYSAVSGLYGPGAFWAWIISCVMAFCPNEGLVLLRHIWSDPIVGLENSDILDLPRPQGTAEGSGESSGHDLDTRDEIDHEKLYSLRRLLDCIFCLSFLKNEDKPELVTDILDIFSRGSGMSLWSDYPDRISTFPSLRLKLHIKYERATGERAERILGLCSHVSKTPSKSRPGFIEYRAKDCVGGDILYRPFFKDVTAEFPWFQMEFDDFHHHLIDLRNRFQLLQYRRELRELPSTLCANTCAAIAYPLIACCVQLTRHFPFQNHNWEARDEAVASVAQISSMMSVLALLSNRPSFNVFTLRHAAWMAVYLCSWTFLCCRAHYVCIEQNFLSYFTTFQVPGFIIVLSLGTIWFPPMALLAWCLSDPDYQPEEPQVPRVQIYLAFLMGIITPIVTYADRSKLDPLCAVSSWDVHFSLPLPRSSVSLGELDQAAALATAIFLMVSTPLQRALSSLDWLWFLHAGTVIVNFFVPAITWSQEKYHKMNRVFQSSSSDVANNNEVELSDRDGAPVEEGRGIQAPG